MDPDETETSRNYNQYIMYSLLPGKHMPFILFTYFNRFYLFVSIYCAHEICGEKDSTTAVVALIVTKTYIFMCRKKIDNIIILHIHA